MTDQFLLCLVELYFIAVGYHLSYGALGTLNCNHCFSFCIFVIFLDRCSFLGASGHEVLHLLLKFTMVDFHHLRVLQLQLLVHLHFVWILDAPPHISCVLFRLHNVLHPGEAPLPLVEPCSVDIGVLLVGMPLLLLRVNQVQVLAAILQICFWHDVCFASVDGDFVQLLGTCCKWSQLSWHLNQIRLVLVIDVVVLDVVELIFLLPTLYCSSPLVREEDGISKSVAQ